MFANTETTRTREPFPSWLFVVLIILAALAALPLLKGNVRIGTAVSQPTPAGQCQFDTRSFATPQEAFTLAQYLEQYRIAHPTARNYGMGSYTICYKDGTQQRFPSPVAPGFSQTPLPHNATHSEQAVYQWLLQQFMALALDASTIRGIYVVIFSQVQVCVPCQSDMIDWLRNLRQAAKTPKVGLSIWDIARGKGFVPTLQPAGSGTPIAIEDIEKVPIPFAL